MKDSPMVSVIIPVYNGERYLAEAIDSVLAQTSQPAEVIVVDDGATDGSGQVAQRFGPVVRYVYQPNRGTAAARNRGVNLAKGIFLAFLDADDLWVENKLALQMEAFKAHPEAEAVFGHVKQFLSPDLDPGMRERIRCPDRLMPGYLPYAMLIKRQAFFRVGLFETQWRVGGDMNWMLRVREHKLCTIMLPDLVYLRRLHATNKGIIQRQLKHQRVHILKAALDRRRRMASVKDQRADEG